MLEAEISDIVKKSSSTLGPNFKEFHANRLNDENWKILFPIYEQVLQKVFHRVQERNLGLFTIILSEERFKGNAGWLTGVVQKAITDRESAFGMLFKSFEQSDLPTVFYRITQLFPILRYRELLGVPGDQLEYFPDSMGKVLNYTNSEFDMTGTLPFSLPLKYLDIIRMLGDAFMKTLSAVTEQLNFENWPTSEQHLVKFEPTDSKASYLIQSCDIVSNFMYSFIRHTVGLAGTKYELKSSALTEYMDLENFVPVIQSSFTVDGGDVICSNENLWGKISPIA